LNLIVDDIGKVVQSMRGLNREVYGDGMKQYLTNTKVTVPNQNLMPFYLYGHPIEINKILVTKDKDKVRMYQKYPLIALRMDTEEEFTTEGLVKFNLNIAIISYTDRAITADKRYDTVFRPVLYPIYEQFMEQLGNSGLFSWSGSLSRPPHTKVDRPYWGTIGEQGNEANKFDDPLDAIEILNLSLLQTIKC
jgi:hypothetical protein